MKLRIAAVILVLLFVLGWLRLRGPHEDAGKANGQAARTSLSSTEAVTPKATPPVVREVMPTESKVAATNAEPSVEKASALEKPDAASTPPKASPRASAATNLPLPRFVGGHRANVPPGGALVIGGWRQPDGNRLLMFASPKPQPDGINVLISSRFLAIPPTRLRGGGWERFFTDDSVSEEGGVFTAAEYAEVMKQIEGFEDVDVLTSPMLTTTYGQQAQIMIGSAITVNRGQVEQISDGIMQGVIVRQVEGSEDLDMAVTAAQFATEPKP